MVQREKVECFSDTNVNNNMMDAGTQSFVSVFISLFF